jgi:hypothetical protein
MCCIWNEATRRFKGLTVMLYFNCGSLRSNYLRTAHPNPFQSWVAAPHFKYTNGDERDITRKSRAIDRGRVMDARELTASAKPNNSAGTATDLRGSDESHGNACSAPTHA